MTHAPLPRLAIAIINALAPPTWRESVTGDLAEERHRRMADGRYAGALWAIAAALATSIQLRRSHHEPVATSTTSPSPFNSLGFELTQAVRALRRRPGFALVTIVTLTLGIGANTAVYSLANWLMFRPVPGVTAPETLVTIRQEIADDGGFYTMSVSETKALGTLTGLAGLTGHNSIPLHVAIDGQRAARLDAEIVTSNYFDVLGQRLTLGRGFSAAEDDPGRASVVVISDRLWREALAAEPTAIGRSLTINGHPFVVVGVAAKGFRGPDRSGRADLWVPIASARFTMAGSPDNVLTSRFGVFFSALGRLAPGSTIAQVNEQAAVLRTTLMAATPGAKSKLESTSFIARPGLDVPSWQRDGLRQTFTLLLAVVALLLVLTCANVANLLFARAHERAAELATQQALGASRGRMIRQLVLEGLLLAIVGGALSLGSAAIISRLVNGLVISQTIPALSAVSLDWRVFAFATAISVATCVGASLLPALIGSRVDVISALKRSGRGQAPAGRRVRRVLTTVQVSVAVTLLATGLLLVRSMQARYSVPLGFDANRVLAFSIEPGLQGHPDERTRQLYQSLLAQLREQAGVASASLAWIEPFRMIGGGLGLTRAGSTDKPIAADGNYVTRDFFRSLGASIISGRDFTDDESLRTSETGGSVILNAALARTLFGTTDAAGRVVRDRQQREYQVVGVVQDIRTRAINAKPVGPVVYEPFAQKFVPSWATVHVRLSAPVANVLPRVRSVVEGLDAQLPIYDVEMLDDAVNRHLAEHRLVTRTIAGFAVLATLVAALGLYGVLARGVEERRREFSIRAALGAGPRLVIGLVTREALAITITGAVIGIGVTVALSRYIESRIFGISARDPLSMTAALALVVVVALLSVIAPARRAARVDVVKELR